MGTVLEEEGDLRHWLWDTDNESRTRKRTEKRMPETVIKSQPQFLKKKKEDNMFEVKHKCRNGLLHG